MNFHRWSRSAFSLQAGVISAALSLGSVSACSSSGQPQSAANVEKKQAEVQGRLDRATQLISELRPKVPDDVANRARCVVIVPGLQKGGLVIGGEGGKGFATCVSRGAWSPPAPIAMGGGTVGAQVGYESADVLALIMSDVAVKSLEAGNFKIGAGASASAGPVGTGTSAAGDMGVKSDILTYSNSGGLFAGATLNGMTLSSDDEATRALYGSSPDLTSILERQITLPGPTSVQRFVGTMTGSFPPASISQR
jgi:SH3 domain-containing YSC84-like protein 1